MNEEIKKLNEEAEAQAAKINKALLEAEKAIVGQKKVMERLMIALIADGHVLLEGVPGLAKTLMIKTISETISAKFNRIQFTPDLLPADIIGTKIYHEGEFRTKKGPIFANFILADEINRAPPKVQSALLEAMQERQVTIGEDTYRLDKPFLVLATQNPIETEGTYRLPEAQVDRFMLKVNVGYPTKEEEEEIIERMTTGPDISIENTLTPAEIGKIQKFNRKIYADKKIVRYATEIVQETRHHNKELIEYGASPRASIWLILGGKAHAMLNGRGYVIPEDIKEIAHDVLRHRIMLTYEAEAEGVGTDRIIGEILEKVKVP